VNSAASRKVTHRAIQRYAVSAREVFPMLCPVREKEWDPDWDCTMLYSRSGLAEEDCVFRTVDEEGLEEIWYITEHDPSTCRMELVRICSPSRAGKISIAVRETAPDACEVDVAYTFVSLNEEGDRFLADCTRPRFAEFMKAWERALGHFLQTGSRVESMEY
jgi:hypothetical protein